MNIELYIEGQLIDLSDQLDYTLNKCFKDLLNPTDIKTDFSKTIKVPFSPRNNIIFGNIYRFDQQQFIISGSHIFQYFDPARKLKAVLKFNQMVIFEGYAKMQSISNDIKNKSYNINLFGNTASIFYELKKLVTTVDKLNPGEDGKYIMTDYFNPDGGTEALTKVIVNRNLIKDSFINSAPLDPIATPKATSNFNRFGFAPIWGGLYPDFDSKSIYAPETVEEGGGLVITNEKILSLVDILKNGGIPAGTAETGVGEGILPRALGEFRSYMNKPFIFANRYFVHILNNLKRITGIDYSLDDTWFNKNNPYWHNLVYMCKNLYNSDQGESNKNSYLPDQLHKMVIDRWKDGGKDPKPWKTASGQLEWKIVNEETPCLSGAKLFTSYKTKTTNIKGNLKMCFQIYREDFGKLEEQQIRKNNGFGFQINFYTYDGHSNIKIKSQRYWLIQSGCDFLNLKPADVKTIVLGQTDAEGKLYFTIPVDVSISAEQHAKFTGDPDKIYFYYGTSMWALYTDHDMIYPAETVTQLKYTIYPTDGIVNATITNNKRSGREITYADLIDISPADFVFKYLKMFNLVSYVKDNILYIQRFNTFFKDYKVTDYTEKLDKTQELTMTPVIFDNKYLKMNYDTPETYVNKEYEAATTAKYGELKLRTNYTFNEDTKDIFKGINAFSGLSPNVLDWDELYLGTFRTRQIKEIYGCYYKREDNKLSLEDYDNCFAFWNGHAYFDKNFRDVYITDDAEYENVNEKYMYHLLAGGGSTTYLNKLAVKVDRYNLIDDKILKSYLPAQSALGNRYSRLYYCMFNVPKFDYTYKEKFTTSVDNKKIDIYSSQFENYFNEIYNLNNFKMECYLYLTNLDFINFQFNNFITINNQLFFINKIIDFNPTKKGSTKCELVKVSDIKNYTGGQTNVPIFNDNNHEIIKPGGNWENAIKPEYHN